MNYNGLHGPPAAMVVEELVEGCVWMSPIRGDTLRHVYTEPQVYIKQSIIYDLFTIKDVKLGFVLA